MDRSFLPFLALIGLTQFSLVACDTQVVSLDRFSTNPATLQDPTARQEALAAVQSGDPSNACWSKPDTAKQIAPVRTRVLVEAAQVDADGTIVAPPVYRTNEAPVDPTTDETWFETPCPPVYTPEFIASLQRALTARDYYRGPITSQMDPRTKQAVRRYQRDRGLQSAVLSTASARSLGLVVVIVPKPDT